MKLYKDSENTVFAYELDGSQDHLIENKTSITQEEADALVKIKSQQEFNLLTYAEKRQSEYPNFLDYLDGVVKGDQDQINSYINACKAVKEKYPKVNNNK